MSSAVAVERRAGAASPSPSAGELRALLDEVLAEVDADDRAGALLRATGLRLRLRIEDAGLTLDVAASEERGNHLTWSFAGDDSFKPKLELEMDSEVANRYLQGRESLAVAIARRRVRVSGESRVALLYLPAMRLVCEPYRRAVRDRYPHLAVA